MARWHYSVRGLLLAGALVLAGCGGRKTVVALPSAAAGADNAKLAARPLSVEERAEASARFMSGLSHGLNEEPDQALDELTRAALADPGAEELVVDVSQTLIQTKRYTRAEELLKKAVAQPGAGAMVYSQLGLLYLRTGRTNEAVQVNQTGISRCPGSPVCYLNLYNLHAQEGRFLEAGRVVDQAAKAAEGNAAFLVDVAELYRSRNRLLKTTNTTDRVLALGALDRASALKPTNYLVLTKMAESYARLGEPAKAAAAYVVLSRQFPDFPNLRERLAELFLRGGDRKGAAEQLEGIIRKNPTNPQAYYFLGAIAHEEKRYKDAADSYRKTLLLDPNFEQVYYDLALSELGAEQPKEALEVLARARKQFGQTFLGEFVTALAWTRQKDYTNALRYFTAAEVVGSATETNRLTPLFYFQYGAACERGGRWSEAEKLLRKAIDMAPDFNEALNYLGYMWAEKGTNLVEARSMIDRALKQEPDNGAYLDSLGWVFFRMGQPAEALKQIQRAIEHTEEPDATLYEHLGDILAELKQPAKAREAWEKSLKIEPTDAVKKKLESSKP